MKDWKMYKRIYKNHTSVFVNNLEEVLNDTSYRNRFDEYVLKRIGIGYMMMALDAHLDIKEKLTDEDIKDLIYSIGCYMADSPAVEAIAESRKYDLDI